MNQNIRRSLGVSVLCLLITSGTGLGQGGETCYLETFEGGTNFGVIHSATGGLVPGTPIRFEPAFNWLYINDGFGYANNPSGTGIAIWSGSNEAAVTFEDPVSSVSFFYGSYSIMTIEAFNVADQLVDTVSGPANFNTQTFDLDIFDPVELDVGSNVITHIVITGLDAGTAIDDFQACQAETEIEVTIDLKPENSFNAVDPFNLNSNKPVEVAVLSTAEFDAQTIDQSSVELGDPLLVPRIGAVSVTSSDVDGDGLTDVIFDFGRARDFGDAGALDSNSAAVELTGSTTGGTDIVGTDDIVIVGN